MFRTSQLRPSAEEWGEMQSLKARRDPKLALMHVAVRCAWCQCNTAALAVAAEAHCCMCRRKR
jgi:hypothetical protein